MIEEILVTAERRTQNLQETPIAITALSADTIEQTGMSTRWRNCSSSCHR